MSANTKIEWCDHTWSPMNPRNGVLIPTKNWRKPLQWNKDPFIADYKWVPGLPQSSKKTHRRSVFPSSCDWLDDEVPIEWLSRFLQLIHDTPNLIWLLLTKRPEQFRGRLIAAIKAWTWADPADVKDRIEAWVEGSRPFLNVWVGTSVEDQERADERIPEMLKISAAKRFLVIEPLIGSVENIFLYRDDGITGLVPSKSPINWVIVGGESGPVARPCNVESIESIIHQCATAKVPCFLEQVGSNPIGPRDPARPWRGYMSLAPYITHPKGGDPDEWPEDLRVRQFPEVKP